MFDVVDNVHGQLAGRFGDVITRNLNFFKIYLFTEGDLNAVSQDEGIEDSDPKGNVIIRL